MSFLTRPQAEALRTLRERWNEDEIVVIGAAALRYHLGHDWRVTQDLDLSIATSVEAAAEVLGDLPGWTRVPMKEQRWIAPGDTRIDIIPASAELLAQGELHWPDSDFRMSLRGFGLAFEYGELVELPGGTLVLVASLPTIVVLKMASYLDRPNERERDLDDLAVILERGVPENDDDRYDAAIIEADLSYEKAGPFVLGQRVAGMVGEDERRLVRDFLAVAWDGDTAPFVLELLARLGPASWNRDVEQASLRLRAFEQGFGVAE